MEFQAASIKDASLRHYPSVLSLKRMRDVYSEIVKGTTG